MQPYRRACRISRNFVVSNRTSLPSCRVYLLTDATGTHVHVDGCHRCESLLETVCELQRTAANPVSSFQITGLEPALRLDSVSVESFFTTCCVQFERVNGLGYGGPRNLQVNNFLTNQVAGGQLWSTLDRVCERCFNYFEVRSVVLLKEVTFVQSLATTGSAL